MVRNRDGFLTIEKDGAEDEQVPAEDPGSTGRQEARKARPIGSCNTSPDGAGMPREGGTVRLEEKRGERSG
jgi:hypothetical protein